MRLLIFLVLSIFNLSFADTTKECLSKFPSISSVIKAVEPLKIAASGKSKLKFSELIKKAEEVEKIANKNKSKIQALGCAETLHDIDPCIKPIDWNCKSLPFGVDFDFLKDVKKNDVEQKAFLSYQLYKSVNLLQVCCNDLGCLENGIGIPNVLFEKERLFALVELAGNKGFFSDIALKSLELSALSIPKANCSCPPPPPEDSKRILEDLNLALKKLDAKSKKTKVVEKAVKPLVELFQKGFPQNECKLLGE